MQELWWWAGLVARQVVQTRRRTHGGGGRGGRDVLVGHRANRALLGTGTARLRLGAGTDGLRLGAGTAGLRGLVLRPPGGLGTGTARLGLGTGTAGLRGLVLGPPGGLGSLVLGTAGLGSLVLRLLRGRAVRHTSDIVAGRRLGHHADLLVLGVELLGRRTVDLVPPDAREALLVEDGAVGAEEGQLDRIAARHGTAHVEGLAASLHVSIVT